MGVWGNTTGQWRSLVIKYVGTDIPADYVLTLIDYESGGNENDVNSSSGATGLLQITKVALNDFNQRHGTNYQLTDALDPELNISIGVELLRRIVTSYTKSHPVSLAADWRSARWVALVTLGWNAGYSERAGVGYVVGKLEAAGIEPGRITAETVSQLAAKLPDASRYLAMPDRVSWANRVTKSYGAGGGQVTPNGGSKPAGSKTPYIVAAVTVVGVGGYLAYRYHQKQKREERKALRELEAEEHAAQLQQRSSPTPRYVMVPMPEVA